MVNSRSSCTFPLVSFSSSSSVSKRFWVTIAGELNAERAGGSSSPVAREIGEAEGEYSESEMHNCFCTRFSLRLLRAGIKWL